MHAHSDDRRAAVADDDDALTRTLGGTSDALPLLLGSLSLQEQRHAALVSHSWASASAECRASGQSLDLRRYSATLDDETLTRVLRESPQLRSLNIASCAAITDAGLAALAEGCCPHLADLNIACLPRVSAEGVGRVADALGASQLTSLELGGCTAISSDQLVARFGAWLELDEDEDGLDKVQG